MPWKLGHGKLSAGVRPLCSTNYLLAGEWTRPVEIAGGQGISSLRCDHASQETETLRPARIRRRPQLRRQRAACGRRTRHRPPENLAHPPYRLPPPLATFEETITATIGLLFYRLR